MSEVLAADLDKINLSSLKSQADERSLFGFWLYIMTDCVLFASLFAVYAVLRLNTFGGPSGKDLFNPPYFLAETLILLTSSFSCGLGLLSARRHNKRAVFTWFGLTMLLGFCFLGLEINEFHHFISLGDSWRRSGFLSAFFTLVSTHGLHITTGLIWMGTMMGQIYVKGFSRHTLRRLTMLSLFWHFLDIVWIFIFTIVYLVGVA